MTIKKRLDLFLVDNGFLDSREKAKKIIMTGNVFVNNQRVDKSGFLVNDSDHVEVKGNPLPYVSRGGLKIEKAIKTFKISLSGKIAIDVGASTGGFTDCMLQAGANKVYAVDVGYGQLDWKLRQDERVVVMERFNARNLSLDTIGESCDFASIDVSFISLKLIIPPLLNCLKEQGEFIALIKPQFEAGREKVGKKGVVKEASTHIDVLRDILFFCAEKRVYVADLSFSPIRGPEGNIEFLLYVQKGKDIVQQQDKLFDMASIVVQEAHRAFQC